MARIANLNANVCYANYLDKTQFLLQIKLCGKKLQKSVHCCFTLLLSKLPDLLQVGFDGSLEVPRLYTEVIPGKGTIYY